jgi:hypothetical protein
MLKALGLTFDVRCTPCLLLQLSLKQLQYNWPYLMPQLSFILTYILSVVLCLAVGIMLSWHLWSICKGETSVEGLDHDVYRNVAKQRGEVSVRYYGNRCSCS